MLKKQKKTKLYKKLLLILISSILTLTVCEFLIHILVSDDYFLFQPNTVYQFKVNSTSIKGIQGQTQFRVNKDGYRGKPYNPEADYHIVTIGGSTTECFYLHENETWPFLLEQRLTNSIDKKVWVGNLGKSGLNSKHHIAQIKYLIPKFPKIDLVINDVLRALKYAPNYNSVTSKEVMKTTFVYHPNDTNNTFIQNLTLLQLVSGKKRLFFPDKTVDLDIDGSNTDIYRNNRFLSKKIIKEVPNLKEELDRYQNNITTIINLCRELNTPIVFINQPTLWKANMSTVEIQSLWLGANGDYTKKGQPYFSHSVLRNCMDLFNKRLKESVEKSSMQFIDLDSKLDRSMNYFYDGMHFNEKGAKKVSTILEHPIQSILED